MFAISVIIPTYRPTDYIFECLDSLLYQTLETTKFEIIIVLNGCNDPYYDSLNTLLKDSIINYKLIQTDNANVSNARNLGLNAAVGDYICFIDDDDYVSPNYLSNLLNKVTENVIVVSNVRAFNESNSFEEDYISEAFKKKYSKENLFSKRSFLSSSCCKIIPVKIINGRRFNLNFKKSEDALFMATISDRIDKIMLTEPDTYYYRRLRNNSASRLNDRLVKRIANYFLLCFEFCKIYLQNPFKYNVLFFASRIIALLKVL